MESTIVSIIGGIILRIMFPDPIVLLKNGEPDFLSNIPPGHYVGISSLHHDITRAKDEAILDAIRQIFMKVGSEYHIVFDKSISGSRRNPDIKIIDSVNIDSSGILADIEVRKICTVKNKLKYRVYLLIFFPQSKIIEARHKIDKENSKRMAQFNSYINQGKASLSDGELEDALRQFRFAFGLTDDLFTTKGSCRRLSESYIDETLELIKVRDEQIRIEALKQPILKVSSLVMTDKCFTFEIAEVNGKDVSFDSYTVDIQADYNNARLISYYVMKVAPEKNVSRSFDLIRPVRIKGNTTKVVMIPFNSWVKENMDDLSSFVLGSQIKYEVVLHSGDLSMGVR